MRPLYLERSQMTGYINKSEKKKMCLRVKDKQFLKNYKKNMEKNLKINEYRF